MKRIVIMALLLAGSCARSASPGPGTLTTGGQARIQQPPDPPSDQLRQQYAEANATLMSTRGLSNDAIGPAHVRALESYNRILAEKPDYMDALNDKAWILATSPDATLRQPKESLDLAYLALNSLASSGMLRSNREALPEDFTTGRVLVASTTLGAALAANGVFAATDVAERAAASCGASADIIMAFVVESAARMDEKFHTPTTAEMLSRAKEYQATFQQRKPLIGAVPLASLTAPGTRLH